MPEKTVNICDVCTKGSYNNEGMTDGEGGLNCAARICYFPTKGNPPKIAVLCRRCWSRIENLIKPL